ncbi:NAD(P)-dependent oxidoreductase [Nocardioides sp. cx-169]|uniref:NAD(P)-dependent oxidoreductase n=1 Tax=Nocardioides sp. cx-169 TaxID=2899080 RepID=UPI001E5ED9C7|nr:NAD(P)-dependent oxidoreductase [Nocardioides sp. cx-169]MCD4534300.1 NAD(P)-dependent oxidoreductase [Nocardioides sp. cx-169]
MTAQHLAFIGLGNMGLPMALRLVAAGHRVTGHDVDAGAVARAQEAGLTTAGSAVDAVDGTAIVVLMLPNSEVVEAVVDGLHDVLPTGTTVVDMSSSDPMRTRALARSLAERGVALTDAPVSGGVVGAMAGTLTVMVGGEPEAVERVSGLLAELGTVKPVGGPGAGHALKALNNLLSGVHLLASSEAIEAGRRFGLEYDVMLDVINTSTGRSWSTQYKYPTFVVPETFDSGFSLTLLVKDMRTASSLCEEVDLPARLGAAATALWAEAEDELAPGSDHTAIAPYVRDKDAS